MYAWVLAIDGRSSRLRRWCAFLSALGQSSQRPLSSSPTKEFPFSLLCDGTCIVACDSGCRGHDRTGRECDEQSSRLGSVPSAGSGVPAASKAPMHVKLLGLIRKPWSLACTRPSLDGFPSCWAALCNHSRASASRCGRLLRASRHWSRRCDGRACGACLPPWVTQSAARSHKGAGQECSWC